MIINGHKIEPGANLYGANLSGANLSGANLYRADLRGADLLGANLYEANLYRANLRGADLYRADLSEADLRGADLSGADLRGADLIGANLAHIIGKQICIYISTPHFAYCCDGYIKIGCKGGIITDWLNNYEKIGKENNYSDEEIEQYGNWIILMSLFNDKEEK